MSENARAQESAPAPADSQTAAADEAEDEGDDIVVLAERGDEIRIDRRTYTLRDDPVAQSTNMFDILGRIPSVSVAPSGEITLLGASNVTIQINNRPVPGANLEQVLRGLPGGSVERIEVITNPSAQYSSSTSGGIINIITRQRFETGFSGSVQANADSLGSQHLGLAPSYSQGRWTFSGQAGGYSGEYESELHRVRETPPGGPATTETGPTTSTWEGLYLSQLQAAFNPNERLRMSLSGDFGLNNSTQSQLSSLSDSGGPVSSSQALTDSEMHYESVTFDLQQQGNEPRELLKFNTSIDSFVSVSNSTFTITPAGGGGATSYATTRSQDNRSLSSNLDFEQPLPSEQFLTFGAAFEHLEQTTDSSLTPLSGVSIPAYASTLEASAQTSAAYATYQFDVGDWTLLPGLRVESYRREVISGALETDDTNTRAFPSLHVRNELTPHINVDISYSSRIQRPGFDQLDPALRFEDVNRASSGNPNLDPTTTDAYEANVVYQRNGTMFNVTFFDRISQDIISQFTDITPDGVTLTRPVNAGESEQRGLQVMLRGPIVENWRYSLTGSVFSREFDYLSGGTISRREELEYNGVAQIDYRDADQEAVGANQFQFETRFQGPRHGLQTEWDEFVVANFTWRRRLSSRLFGVLTVQDIFDSANRSSQTITDDYYERAEFQSPGTRLRLSLTYQFGSGPQRPPTDQQPGGPPGPSF
ncbi:TonB-dependent receptor plug domain-containing protein [Candidatus Viadribacter manganicus]|nr:TonB-dependent receptor [Candidatus Viadribacter manganicus]